MVTPDAKRGAVAQVCAVHGVSQRRACDVLAVDRSSIRYKTIRPDDAAERAAMKAVAAERRRFGYRRIHIMLNRQGTSDESQEVAQALWRGAAAGPQARRAQKGLGNTAADG